MRKLSVYKVVTVLVAVLPGTTSSMNRGPGARSHSHMAAATDVPAASWPGTVSQPHTVSDAVVLDQDGGVSAHGRSLLHGCHYSRCETSVYKYGLHKG